MKIPDTYSYIIHNVDWISLRYSVECPSNLKDIFSIKSKDYFFCTTQSKGASLSDHRSSETFF